MFQDTTQIQGDNDCVRGKQDTVEVLEPPRLGGQGELYQEGEF